MKHLVIAGGGFAGVRLARLLRKQKNLRVTVINDSGDFRYSPALYRAVTGLKLGTARIPLEWMLLDIGNATLQVGKVEKLNKSTKTVALDNGLVIEYDYIVFALGAVTSYFGIEGLDRHSFGVKNISEAVELKNHIHEKLTSKVHTEQNYVIVGAGPTGVEVAGAFSSYLMKIAKKHRVNKKHISIYLVEAGVRILPQMSSRSAKAAQKRLTKHGVKILTNTMVKSESINTLKTSNGNIQSHNVIWTAGTANNPFFKKHEEYFSFDPKGKIIVDKYLQAGREVYVCGDNASTPKSGLALTAIWHANFIAKDLKRRLKHKKRKPHRDKIPIQVVPIDSAYGILQYRFVSLHGRLIGLIRRIADLFGYCDVLGFFKALTIWQNSDKTEEICAICNKK